MDIDLYKPSVSTPRVIESRPMSLACTGIGIRSETGGTG